MPPVVRRVLSALGGTLLAGLVVQAIEALGNQMYPLPSGTNLDDPANMKQAVASLPAAAFLMVLAGWVVGAFVGAFVASQLSGRTKRWPGIVVGLLVLAESATELPHPIWTWILAILLVPAAALGATYLAMRHPGDADPL